MQREKSNIRKEFSICQASSLIYLWFLANIFVKESDTLIYDKKSMWNE